MGWLTLFASVGSTPAKNNKRDIKIVQALLNPYLRREGKTSLSITGTIDNPTTSAISDFQKNYVKMTKVDGRVDKNGNTYKNLIKSLKESYTTQAVNNPDYGVVTWESEGKEGGMYHSRKLHVPGLWSGLTIGRGYDMKFKSQSKIASDLTKAGINTKLVQALKSASGLHGNTAKQFIIDNDLLDAEISVVAQKNLFKISYEDEAKEVKRICNSTLVKQEYGETDWEALNKNIKDMVVDLKFRGDYTGTTRKFLQSSIVDNDLEAFKKEIVKKANWTNVPEDRFNRRKLYIEKAPLQKK